MTRTLRTLARMDDEDLVAQTSGQRRQTESDVGYAELQSKAHGVSLREATEVLMKNVIDRLERRVWFLY